MIDFVPVEPTGGTVREIERRAESVRAFNRFYTRRIGALGEGHLGSAHSLTEVRVLFELAHRGRTTAGEIGGVLGLDRGYLSRTLRTFRTRGLIDATTGPDDRRRTLLRLTAAGRKAFAPLDAAARAEIVAMLQPLSAPEQRRLLDAMDTVRRSFERGASPGATAPYILRDHRPGDMGWVVHRHGVLYFEEYRYDERFEALVAEVVAHFIQTFDARRERCWIAERGGEIVGSVFVAAKSRRVAKLRLLLVEPSARGLGLGRHLVNEVIRFSRRAGYSRLELWTQSELKAARRIYIAAGFVLVAEEKHESFGKPLVAETWVLELG